MSLNKFNKNLEYFSFIKADINIYDKIIRNIKINKVSHIVDFSGQTW